MKEQEEFIEEFALVAEKIETAAALDKDATPWLNDLCDLMKKYGVCKEDCNGIPGR